MGNIAIQIVESNNRTNIIGSFWDADSRWAYMSRANSSRKQHSLKFAKQNAFKDKIHNFQRIMILKIKNFRTNISARLVPVLSRIDILTTEKTTKIFQLQTVKTSEPSVWRAVPFSENGFQK